MSGCALSAMLNVNANAPVGDCVKPKIARQSCSSRCSDTWCSPNSCRTRSYDVPHCADHLGVMLKLVCPFRLRVGGETMIALPGSVDDVLAACPELPSVRACSTHCW